MTTTTQITDLTDLLDLSDTFGIYADDYDTDAVRDDFIAALQAAAQRIAPSVTVHRNGMVFAAVEDAASAREIAWTTLAEGIDITPMLAAHEKG